MSPYAKPIWPATTNIFMDVVAPSILPGTSHVLDALTFRLSIVI